MLFNSLDFAIFLPIVFALYWFVANKKLKLQNLLIVIVSYVFYGWWDWRFLGLIFFSSVVDYFIGQKLVSEKVEAKRKVLLLISLTVNLGLLGFFKYSNFFIQEMTELLQSMGMQVNTGSLDIILPVGISFYTFQTLSYSIDIYRRKIEAEKNFVSFIAFVSFFPQLVAGPIERASNLLPQFAVKRQFDYIQAVHGMRLILWGLVKKVLIADMCSGHVDFIFNNYETLPGSTLVLGAFYFAFQIYGDFSGYSDMAIGIAALFGFKLMRNFAYPYFSRDIAEFWRRWHISLSTWFRDYLYFPLGGSRGNQYSTIRNTLIIFTVSGFWHGANWTFIVWGIVNALLFLPLIITANHRKHLAIAGEENAISVADVFRIAKTFAIVCLVWVFFRAESIQDAFSYLGGIFSPSLFSSPGHPELTLTPLFYILPFIMIEWLGRRGQNPLHIFSSIPLVFRWSLYLVLAYLIFNASGKEISFIYFQF